MLMTVQLLKPCHMGPAGAEKQVNAQQGRQLIMDGFALETEASIAERAKRQADDQKAQDKAFRERDKRLKKEADEREAAAKAKRVSREKLENKSLSAAE